MIGVEAPELLPILVIVGVTIARDYGFRVPTRYSLRGLLLLTTMTAFTLGIMVNVVQS